MITYFLILVNNLVTSCCFLVGFGLHPTARRILQELLRTVNTVVANKLIDGIVGCVLSTRGRIPGSDRTGYTRQ